MSPPASDPMNDLLLANLRRTHGLRIAGQMLDHPEMYTAAEVAEYAEEVVKIKKARADLRRMALEAERADEEWLRAALARLLPCARCLAPSDPAVAATTPETVSDRNGPGIAEPSDPALPQIGTRRDAPGDALPLQFPPGSPRFVPSPSAEWAEWRSRGSPESVVGGGTDDCTPWQSPVLMGMLGPMNALSIDEIAHCLRAVIHDLRVGGARS